MNRNWLEWLVLTASIVLIALLVGFLAVHGLTSRDEPPDPQVELHLDKARDASLGWIVPVTVSNGGAEAAEAVRFEARATVDGAEETREIEIDYLPAGTDVELEVAFSQEPTGEIQVDLIGYRLP
ncbi:MAG: hypothetical protein H0V12_12250 [Chloroflexi bacterium]|nr:hypothetical protein [Chloroflexota bacterium]